MSTRTRSTLAVFLAAAGALAAAAEPPPPLVKPVVPAGTAVRARVPLAEDERTAVQLKAQIAGPKGKVIDVTVLLESLPQKGTVSLKKWKEWGFDVPANRVGVIPELIVPAAQVAPKPTKGRDVELRLPNVKVDIVETPGGKDGDNVFELFLSLRDLTGGADKAFEPRVHFADKFLELTVPGTGVKRLNAGDATSPDPRATADDKRVPAVGAMQTGGYPVFAFASVNGYTRYATPAGKTETVNVGVSTTSNHAAPGILMTTSTARGCGVEMEKQPGEGEIVAGKVKELRLALLTGAGKAPKDFVLKDVTVHVNDDRSQSFVWLGPRFVEEYFADGVYGCGSDGVWRLHGRVKAELLADVKTRAPAKKP